MIRHFKNWTQDEINTLIECNELKLMLKDAADIVGRTVGACQSQSKRLGLVWRTEPVKKRQMASSEAREPSIFVPTFVHSNLTARIFGDPPPGRSALDQRGQR